LWQQWCIGPDPTLHLHVRGGAAQAGALTPQVDALKQKRITKPVVAWVSGTCAKLFKSEVQFGHAGAKSGGQAESAQVPPGRPRWQAAQACPPRCSLETMVLRWPAVASLGMGPRMGVPHSDLCIRLAALCAQPAALPQYSAGAALPTSLHIVSELPQHERVRVG